MDELVLQCRNETARDRIGEAVRAYKSAAYRSAIIMTWVALAYDLIDKLRELSLSGDAAAAKKVAEYDKLHQSGDVRASLSFEKELLKSARKEFELISDAELIELARIQEDRNRCAHPSLNIDGDAFAPTAELARAHIRAAIEYVLKNEPAQGKYALDIVMRMVQGDYFPRQRDKIRDALSHTPLMTGRKALVRQFIVVMLKGILRDELDDLKRSQYLSCLQFVQGKRADMWGELFTKEVAQLARTLDVKEHGIKVLALVCRFHEVWDVLPAGLTSGLELLMRELPTEHIDLLSGLIEFRPLQLAAAARVKKLRPDDVSVFYMGSVPPLIWSHVVQSLCKADSYAEANAWASEFSGLLVLSAAKLTQDDANRMCDTIIQNRQLRECNRIEEVLDAIQTHGCASGENWDRMIKETGRDPAAYK
ncbi:hypothetical protein ACI2TD_09425 [Ralstonia nicotianae]|uniref:hypothetical protein n=1 Tax=Ralstonia pseudosolanacearum TaxID=1310165 RepID=UPI0011B3E6C5|nr:MULTISPECIES: hypothetical protein [Ralstonia]MCK4135710.1 hypothetical protein [Ralstonia pseudosolanacearum]MCK4145524.1 hypothetical protein [Ralstonia pseudosolanacearum]QWF63621.1 hypothetical protein KM864_26400 [Ralstonia solanacearum]UZF37089.1 hypothetical protein LGV81_23230 [Ralstonia sp. RS647]